MSMEPFIHFMFVWLLVVYVTTACFNYALTLILILHKFTSIIKKQLMDQPTVCNHVNLFIDYYLRYLDNHNQST